MPRTTTIAAIVALAASSLVGCDDVRRTLDPGAASASAESGADQEAPAGGPALRDGRAQLSLDGDVRRVLVFDVLTDPASYAGGEGPLNLAWRSSSFDLFTLGGSVRLGRQPTSSALRLQLAAELDGRYRAFASDDGSCAVTVERADGRRVAGDLDCRRLSDANGLTIEITGSFEATVDAG